MLIPERVETRAAGMMMEAMMGKDEKTGIRESNCKDKIREK